MSRWRKQRHRWRNLIVVRSHRCNRDCSLMLPPGVGHAAVTQQGAADLEHLPRSSSSSILALCLCLCPCLSPSPPSPTACRPHVDTDKRTWWSVYSRRRNPAPAEGIPRIYARGSAYTPGCSSSVEAWHPPCSVSTTPRMYSHSQHTLSRCELKTFLTRSGVNGRYADGTESLGQRLENNICWLCNICGKTKIIFTIDFL